MPQHWITNPIEAWLEAHPAVAWAVNHPLLALSVLLLILFLFGGLMRAIARFTEQIWIALLQAPIKLVQWLLSLISSSYRQRTTAALKRRTTDQQARLAQILERLEAMRQEQDCLLQEVKAILTEKR